MVTIFITVDLRTILCAQFVRMYVIFHMTSSNGFILVSPVKMKVREYFHTATILFFYIVQKEKLNKVAYFSVIYSYESFQDPTLNSAASTSRVCPPSCYYRWQEIKMYGVGMASNSTVFTASFAKICQLVQSLKETYIHSMVISTFFHKEGTG